MLNEMYQVVIRYGMGAYGWFMSGAAAGVLGYFLIANRHWTFGNHKNNKGD